ncbi:putative phage tail protein [Peptococcus simiae]|uniref:putative phage tail protein n=1 Tax=Peptococcus simiae TaxID=1643805 RepID=UPI0039807D16
MNWYFIRDIGLLCYLPPVLQDYEELAVLADVEEKTLIQALHDVNRLYAGIFIDTADGEALALLERQWGIAPPEDATLEDRRLAVRARMVSMAALYTKRSLYAALAALCGRDGFSLDISHSKYSVSVLIELKSKNQAEAVRGMLHDMLPANMVYQVDIRYNQHATLGRLTHGEMAAYTHDQLRTGFKVRELSLAKG